MSDRKPSAAPPLAVGAILGGAFASRDWEHAITELSKKAQCITLSSPLNLRIVYQVPGETWKPKLTGVRVGHFDARRKVLEIRIGLPAQPVGDAHREVKVFLEAAVNAAEKFARSRDISNELSALQNLLTEL